MAHREVPLPELVYSPLPHDAAKPARVWIDADAACGAGKHRDPGDCLALLSPASASDHVIAVVGRRPGHRFHPSENRATGAMLFGHGPVFRDLNAVLDPQAVSVVLASGIPVVLIPYTAARQVLMIGSDLDRVARIGIARNWVAEHRAARGSSSGSAKRGSMAFTPSI